MSFLAIYRLRLLFRGAFLLLALATLALALHVLQDEKQRAYRNYHAGFQKTQQQIVAKLRHPTGQLALLNPRRDGSEVTPLRPMLLPFSAIDFDDPNKVQLAVEMSGCLVQYPEGGLCVAIGNNPWAGGFIYVAGSFAGPELVPHARGDLDLSQAHRLRVEVAMRGQTYRWLAPFEELEGARSKTTQGRLTGFVDDGSQRSVGRPVKDFRGWIWQEGHCAKPDASPPCERRAFFSLRLPVDVLRDALFQKQRIVWPPADLQQILVHLKVLPPGDGPPLLDSDSSDAVAPLALNDLMPLLLPGESLRIRKVGAATDLLQMIGAAPADGDIPPPLARLIRALPVERPFAAPEVVEIIRTPVGNYQATLSGNGRSIDRSLGVIATQLGWLAGAMLLATLLAWAVIEIGIVRRIAILTRRAAAVSKVMKSTGDIDQFELKDLRGNDELGVLASCLHDLLQRVKEDVAREKIRAEQEKDMWHAVGHEIMSPLQSLMALHGDSANPSARYINRMQQAIRILYGSASPSEALQSSTLEIASIDLDAFLRGIAANAPCVGIPDVVYAGQNKPVPVRADEYSLEDVVTHVLRNAERYRTPGTPITLTLQTGSPVTLIIHNQGPPIAEDLIDRIFEYGVSDQVDAAANGNRGQGLFVAKTYMAKMAGTIVARNVADGVEFVLSFSG